MYAHIFQRRLELNFEARFLAVPVNWNRWKYPSLIIEKYKK